MPGFWSRHRVAAAALVVSSLVTVASVVGDVFQLGYDPLGMAVNALVSMAIGFPLMWAILRLNQRGVVWWRKRHPVPSVPFIATGLAAGEAPPFRWSGRPVRRPWALLGFPAFFVLMGVLALYGQAPGSLAANLTLGFLGLLVIIVSLAAAFAFRRKSVIIDATGIHVERGLKSDVHVRWGELREIGIVTFPLSTWFAPFSVREPPRMIMLRGQDGGAVGMVQSEGDVPREFSAALESAIRAHAAAHGMPVRDVGFREMMMWRRPKRPGLALHRSP